jgi:hypothetical protein
MESDLMRVHFCLLSATSPLRNTIVVPPRRADHVADRRALVPRSSASAMPGTGSAETHCQASPETARVGGVCAAGTWRSMVQGAPFVRRRAAALAVAVPPAAVLCRAAGPMNRTHHDRAQNRMPARASQAKHRSVAPHPPAARSSSKLARVRFSPPAPQGPRCRLPAGFSVFDRRPPDALWQAPRPRVGCRRCGRSPRSPHAERYGARRTPAEAACTNDGG